jgi:hypothetical protein
LQSDPYRIAQRVEDDHYVYFFEFTEEPDPEIAVVIGDIFHNLRSALNYLLIAASGTPANRRTSVQFPIFTEDPYDTTDPKRDKKMLAIWNRCLKGVPDPVIEIVRSLQPYSRLPDQPYVDLLWMLEEVNNTDKHRQLPLHLLGLVDPVVTVTDADGKVSLFPHTGMFKDGQVLGRAPREWDIKIHGLPLVALGVGDDPRYVELPVSIYRLMTLIREDIVPPLAALVV